MRTYAPPLLPIFRSQLQGELLAVVLLSGQERSVSELAAILRAPVPTVAREVARLEEAGLLASRRVGTARLVRANSASPLIDPLTELVLRAFGPATVLAREFSDLDGIERVDIFGSWAARYRGEPGPPPGDIDVLVVGTPDPDALHDAAGRAEQTLGRDVNTVVVSVDHWNKAEDPFLQQIHARPRIPVLVADDSHTLDSQDTKEPR
jgi:DNA-binding transcriptional ArsR family regulator